MTAPEPEPLDFARRLVDRWEPAGPPGWIAGCYLHGSAALGGWNARRSDVDVLVVVTAWSAQVRETSGHVLRETAAGCPGTGLELSVVTADAARRPAPPWPFLLHAAGTARDLRLVDGTTHPGDPDLALHYAVTRAHGLVVAGQEPVDVIGEVPRDVLLAQLRTELDWGLGHADEAYVVLNALRAQAYATTGRWLSKTAAGEAAAAAPGGPHDLVERALAVQRGGAAPRPPGDEAHQLVRNLRAAIPWPPGHGAWEHEA